MKSLARVLSPVIKDRKTAWSKLTVGVSSQETVSEGQQVVVLGRDGDVDGSGVQVVAHYAVKR